MRLKRLDLLGFKTFASRATLEFAPGITAIVGPNGSGKSNVADAVRWVLGEQSLKLLRGRRSEDVIFGGGAGRAPVGMAEVSLTFDNSEAALPVEFTEIAIGRRAFRSGENEYHLNKSRVRLRDIVDLLSRAGVGQNGHSVIGQGLVDLALSLRPEERRGLFEDAAGLRRFNAKRDEADGKLAEVHANATRVADLIAELEPRVAQLQRQARRSQDEARLRAAWRSATETLLAHERWETEQALAGLQPDAARHSSTRAAAAAGAGEAAQTGEDARRRLDEARARLVALAFQRNTLRDAFERLHRQVAVQQERRAAAARLADGLDADLKRLLARVEEAEAAVPAANTATEEAQAALAAARAALAGAQETLQAKRQAGANDAAALAAARAAAAEATRRLTQATTAQGEAERQLATVTKQTADAAGGRASAEDAAASATARLAALDEATAARRAAQKGLHEKRSLAAQARAQAQQQRDTLAAQIARLDREIEALGVRLAVLKDLSHQAGTPAAGTAAAPNPTGRAGQGTRTEGKATGGTPGGRPPLGDRGDRDEYVRGRRPPLLSRDGGQGIGPARSPGQPDEAATLAGHLEVAPELEAAVAAAAGASLEWVVVETFDQAARLARANAQRGDRRITYLARDRAERAAGAARATIPAHDGGRGYLIELVAAPGAAGLSEAAIGRAYLVENLDAALALDALLDRLGQQTAPNRPSIVTMSGELVDRSGAITSGKPPPAAGLLQRLREMRDLERRLAHAQATRAPLAAAHAERCLEVERRQQEERTYEQELRALQQQESREDGERRGLTQQQAKLHKDLAWWEEFAGRAQAQETHLRDRLRALAEQRRRAEIAQAQAAESLERLAARAAEREHELASLAEQAAAARTAAAVAEQRLAQATQRAAAAAATAANATSELNTAQTRRSKVHEEVAQLDQALEQGRTEHAAHGARLDAVERELGAGRAQVAAHETALEQARGAAERARAEAAQAERELALLEAKRATLEERRHALHEHAARDIGDLPPARESDTPPDQLADRLTALQNRLRALGPVNQVALQEHAEASERLAFLRTQLADLRAAAAKLEATKSELEAGVREGFVQTFEAVAEHFRDYFRRLFGGGDARLVLTDANNVIDTGVDIVAQLPGKRRQELAFLSGGERALVAAALLFALLKARPSPFCVMDEVDAALDEANVGRFCEVLEELSAETQFVLVTHNRATMERADALYGVTLGEDGVSRVVSLKLPDDRADRNGAAHHEVNGMTRRDAGAAGAHQPGIAAAGRRVR
ncbi:MAG: AAA family ATPase [Chloroflexi bacterium]|nr:AAA family ATPase [Chloroflexota bacterium]